MQLFRVVSFLAFSLTLRAFTLASPAPIGFEVEKRTGSSSGDNTAAIEGVLSTLKSVTEEVLPEIMSVIGHNNATFGVVEPLVQDLVYAIDNAHASLLAFGTVSLGNSVNATELTSDVVEIINNIVSAVESVDSSVSGLLSSLFSSIDVEMYDFLSELEGLVPTILSLVSPLLDSLDGINSGTLSGLSLFLVAGLFAS